MTTNPKPKSEEGLVIWNAVCKAIEESKANWKDNANDYEPISLLNHIRYQMELAMGNFILLQDAQDTEDAKNTFDTDTDPQYTKDPDTDLSGIEEILNGPGMNQIFSQPGMENLKKTLSSINESMRELKDNFEKLP